MISDERLRQAAREAGEAMESSLPKPEDCTHEFSPSFEKKMKKLLRRRSRPFSVARRVAAVLLAAALGSGIWLGVDAQAREFIFGWFSNRTENVQHYFFSSEDGLPKNHVRYILPEIPEGYRPYDIYHTDTYVSDCYINDEGKGFSFEYAVASDNSSLDLYLYTGGLEAQEVSVSGSPAEFYRATSEQDDNTLVWRDSDTDTLFWISGFFDQDDLIALAESVTLER